MNIASISETKVSIKTSPGESIRRTPNDRFPNNCFRPWPGIISKNKVTLLTFMIFKNESQVILRMENSKENGK